jgi:hypothetical protein
LLHVLGSGIENLAVLEDFLKRISGDAGVRQA